MTIKHIRWVACIGLLAIICLQYVWLVNTYKLTKESIGSPDKPGGLSIQLCKSEKKEFYIRYSS